MCLSVNYVFGFDVVVLVLRVVLGLWVWFLIDAYLMDFDVWMWLMEQFFGVVGYVWVFGMVYDIYLVVLIFCWFDLVIGEFCLFEIIEVFIFVYMSIAASYWDVGVGGVMFFIGFAVADNIFNDHFIGDLI